MGDVGGKYLTRCKTMDEANEVREKLLEKAKELQDLAENTKGAQFICQGGGCTEAGMSVFHLGCVTSVNRIYFILQQIETLDELEMDALILGIKQLKMQGKI